MSEVCLKHPDSEQEEYGNCRICRACVGAMTGILMEDYASIANRLCRKLGGDWPVFAGTFGKEGLSVMEFQFFVAEKVARITHVLHATGVIEASGFDLATFDGHVDSIVEAIRQEIRADQPVAAGT